MKITRIVNVSGKLKRLDISHKNEYRGRLSLHTTLCNTTCCMVCCKEDTSCACLVITSYLHTHKSLFTQPATAAQSCLYGTVWDVVSVYVKTGITITVLLVTTKMFIKIKFIIMIEYSVNTCQTNGYLFKNHR